MFAPGVEQEARAGFDNAAQVEFFQQGADAEDVRRARTVRVEVVDIEGEADAPVAQSAMMAIASSRRW